MANGFDIERDIDVDDGPESGSNIERDIDVETTSEPTTTTGRSGRLKRAARSFASTVKRGAKEAASDASSVAQSVSNVGGSSTLAVVWDDNNSEWVVIGGNQGYGSFDAKSTAKTRARQIFEEMTRFDELVVLTKSGDATVDRQRTQTSDQPQSSGEMGGFLGLGGQSDSQPEEIDQDRARIERAQQEARQEALREARQEAREEYQDQLQEEVKERELERYRSEFGLSEGTQQTEQRAERPGERVFRNLFGGPLEPDSTSAETPPENTDEAAANALMGLGFNQPGDPAAMVAVDENRNGRFERQEITMFPPGEGMPESFSGERQRRSGQRTEQAQDDQNMGFPDIGQSNWL